MRILHVNDLPITVRSGAEIHISRLAEAQRSAGDEVLHFSPRYPHQGLGRVRDIWDIRGARLLQNEINVVEPDVVHFHNVIRDLSPSVLATTGDVPAVTTVHDLRAFGGLEHHLPDPRAVVDRAVLGPLVRRELKRHMAALVAVSEAVKRHLGRYGFTDVEVVRVPVPAPLVPPTAVEECHDVLFVGRLGPDKGADVLLTAFDMVADRHPHARLVIAGAGPARSKLESQVRTGRRVVFTGQLDDSGVSAAMGKARVVVTPSIPTLRKEGSSLTTAEAARHGRPVVTSDDPAVAEVASMVGGVVVPSGDPEALAGALDNWLSDAAAAAAAGNRARLAAVAVYGVETARAHVNEIYQEIIDHPSRRIRSI